MGEKKTLKRSAILVLALGVIICLAAVALSSSTTKTSWDDPVDQWKLIKFSHKLHTQEVGAECAVCHAAAEESESSADFLFPKQAVCADCHDVESESECGVCHVDVKRMEPFAVPTRTVVFNHKLHLTSEGIGLSCVDCHKEVATTETVNADHLPAMASCTGCHNDVRASNSCETCHTAVETLLPLSHKVINWSKEHKRLIRASAGSDDCAMCHTDNFCQSCHADITLQQTKGAFIREVPENRPMASGKPGLVKQNVHELNYLFVHSIDARAKQNDCYSCHDQRQFCAACHSKNQEAGFAAPRPLSHQGSDFLRIGVGSGGGQHATLARRDIESCAACHDIEGRDPACMTCHVDRNPGKGNDPKTHAANFRNEHGEWHGNPGATCFNCHVDSGQAGVGFCGYCHGHKN